MNEGSILLTIAILGVLAYFIKPLAEELRFPYPSLLVLIGFVVSELLIAFGMDTGLRWEHFRTLVYYVLLPVLIYERAYRLNADEFSRNLLPVLLLALPFLIFAAIFSAVLLYFGVGHDSGFPFIAALIVAAIISANDPAAVTRVVDSIQTPKRLASILKGESLFNSILTLILVSLLVSLNEEGALSSGNNGWLNALYLFVKQFSGGIFTGMFFGLFGLLVLRLTQTSWVRLLLSLSVVYATFLSAELLLQVSGILAVLVAGLMLNAYAQKIEPDHRVELDEKWRITASIASIALFLLLGVAVYLPMLTDRWLLILMALGSALLARAIIVYSVFKLLHKAPNGRGPADELRLPVFWGGIKGAVNVALVFLLPDNLGYHYSIQAAVYGVVLFSLFVQAPTLKLMFPRAKPAAENTA